MRQTKPAQIYKKTGNLRAVQLLLGYTKLESTVRYLGIEVDDTLSISERSSCSRRAGLGCDVKAAASTRDGSAGRYPSPLSDFAGGPADLSGEPPFSIRVAADAPRRRRTFAHQRRRLAAGPTNTVRLAQDFASSGIGQDDRWELACRRMLIDAPPRVLPFRPCDHATPESVLMGLLSASLIEPSTILRHQSAIFPAMAMLAGMQLDLFTRVKDVRKLPRPIEVKPPKLIPPLYALVAAELLTVEGGGFSNMPEAATCGRGQIAAVSDPARQKPIRPTQKFGPHSMPIRPLRRHLVLAYGPGGAARPLEVARAHEVMAQRSWRKKPSHSPSGAGSACRFFSPICLVVVSITGTPTQALQPRKRRLLRQPIRQPLARWHCQPKRIWPRSDQWR